MKFKIFFVLALVMIITDAENVHGRAKKHRVNETPQEAKEEKNELLDDIAAITLPLPTVSELDKVKEDPLFANKGDTLLLVNVIFRHGNRTLDPAARLYPKDPYRNLDYFPYGLGQLVDAGKAREYNLGRKLRRRYSEFLGDYYYPQMVEALSTNINRTKMSLQLVLAGLFPPNEDDKFAKPIGNWQPVPYNYETDDNSTILMGFFCPKYPAVYEEYLRSPQMQALQKKYKYVFDYLEKNSGGKYSNWQDILSMYYTFTTEMEYGLKLPEWTKQVYPEPLQDLTYLSYYSLVGTYDLRKIFVGGFLKKIIADAEARLYANDGRFSKKIYLYSAHELNIATLLINFGVFENEIPTYGANIIFEFHIISGVPGFKLFFDNWNTPEPRPLKLPGCGYFCPLKQFVALLSKVLPADNEHVC